MNDNKKNQGIDNLLNELKNLTEKSSDITTSVQKSRRSKNSDSEIKDLLKKAYGDGDNNNEAITSEYDVDSSDFIITDEKYPPDVEEMPNTEKTEIEIAPEIQEIPETQKTNEAEFAPKVEELPKVEETPEINTSPETEEPKKTDNDTETEEPEKDNDTETEEPSKTDTNTETDTDTETEGPIKTDIDTEPEIETIIEESPKYPETTNDVQISQTEFDICESANGNAEEIQRTDEEDKHILTDDDERADELTTIDSVQSDKSDDKTNNEPTPKTVDDPVSDEEKPCVFEDPSDDTDINMAIALGYSNELRDTVGDTRVKEACTKIAWDNSSVGGEVNLKSDNMAFGYRNYEFSDMCQVEYIKKNFVDDKKKLNKRIAATGILMLIIMLYENTALFGINLPNFMNPATNPVVHMLIALQLIVLCAAPSYKQIYSGILNAILFTPTFMSISAVSVVVSVVYNIISVFTYKSGVPIMFNLSAAFCLFLSSVCEHMNYKREFEAFTFITESHNSDNIFAPLFRHETECKNSSKNSFTYDVRKVDFISKYFYRTNKKNRNCKFFNYFWISLIVIGMILAVLTIAITQNASYAMSAIAAPFAFGLPIMMLVCSTYPLYMAVCKLLRKEATIIGEQSVYQYSEESTYAFEDLNAFPSNNIPSQKIRLYNNSKMYEVLYNIKLLFYKIDSPLVGIVDSSILDFEDVSKDDVQLKRIVDTGVEATIKSGVNILAGNFEFISQYINDFVPSEKDKTIINEGRISILYIALNGELSAKIYVTYDMNKGFLRSVKALQSMGHKTAIMTNDPNINDKLMGKICPDIRHTITVNKPKEANKAQRADCGIVVSGEAKDVIYPLKLCLKIKKVREFALKIQIIASALSMILLTLCCIFVKFSVLSSMLAVLYQAALSVATFIIIRFKLKR